MINRFEEIDGVLYVNLSRFEHDELLRKSAAFDELQANCKQLQETRMQLQVQNEALQKSILDLQSKQNRDICIIS